MKGLRSVLVWCLLMLAGFARAETVLVVAPVDSPVTREFIAVLEAAMPQSAVALHLLSSENPAPSAARMVTMGPDALAWRLQQPGSEPTIATYVSQQNLGQTDAALPEHLQVLLSNPEPGRQIELARRILPRLRSIGVLYSDLSRMQMEAWAAEADAAGLELHSAHISSPRDLGRRVAELLERSDILMAVDDPGIYNADNLKVLLLTSYRRSKVLIGPGPAFIPAGSLSTTYSTPADTARSVAERFAGAWEPGGMTYPDHFSVSSNQHVARSLGLPPLDDPALAQAIRLMEATP